MKTMIKFAAISAVALAASSTAALATSELPAGVTTGLALGAPLPEGVYDISVASYGSRGGNAVGGFNNLAYTIPVWLIWSTPYQIAGGRISLDTATAAADTWMPGGVGVDSFLNTLVEGGINWNLGNGWNAGFKAGAWLPSDQTLGQVLARNHTSFQGIAAVSYVANGWNLSATGIYGAGGGREVSPAATANGFNWTQQGDWFNLDLTATKKLGKMEIGAIAYGSWDLSNSTAGYLTGNCGGAAFGCKQSQFALGGLVGYDFGSFIAQAKLAGDVVEENYNGKEVRGTLTIIKPLWNPASEGPLK